jgi:hypothetical protein
MCVQILVMGVVLVGCTTSPTPTAHSSETPGATIPASATLAPSPPPTKDVALRVDRFTDVIGRMGTLSFVIYGDGRLVRPAELDESWTERYLTAAGRDGVLQVAMTSGLLVKDVSYPPPPNYAAGFGTVRISVRRNGEMVSATAANANRTSAAKAIIRLGNRLISAVDKLPDSSFTGALHPGTPTAVDLVIVANEGVLATYPSPPAFPLWVEEADWPIATPILETGRVYRSTAASTSRCAVVDAHTAASVVDYFRNAGLEGATSSQFAEFQLGWRARNGIVEVHVLAVPPGERARYQCRF